MIITEILNHMNTIGFVPLRLDSATNIVDPKRWIDYHIDGLKRCAKGSFVYETHKYHLLRYYDALLSHHGLPPRTQLIPKKNPVTVSSPRNEYRVPVPTQNTLRTHRNPSQGLPSEMRVTDVRFNGSDYSPTDDDVRLTGQIERVFECMKDGQYRTLAEITAITNDPETSVSSQLRHLRKTRFGSHTVTKRSRGERSIGLFEYKLIPNSGDECP